MRAAVDLMRACRHTGSVRSRASVPRPPIHSFIREMAKRSVDKMATLESAAALRSARYTASGLTPFNFRFLRHFY